MKKANLNQITNAISNFKVVGEAKSATPYGNGHINSTFLVNCVDENGEKQELMAEGFLAIAIQHELDHLDGVIFIDHLSDLRRKMLLKRHEKRLKKAALEEQE